jgi:AcrR family transcriptional regulator
MSRASRLEQPKELAAGGVSIERRKEPVQRRARETVDAILTATERIVREQDFERVTTNEIARLAGVSVGSLYQYFPCKQALIVAVAERREAEIARLIENALLRAATMPLAEGVRAVIETTLDAHVADRALHRAVSKQVLRMGAVERLAERKRLFCFTKHIAAFFEQRRFELRVPDPQLAAFFVVQTVEALSDAVAEHPPAADQQRIAEELTLLIVNYLSKPATMATMPVSRLFSLPGDARPAADGQWADLEP